MIIGRKYLRKSLRKSDSFTIIHPVIGGFGFEKYLVKNDYSDSKIFVATDYYNVILKNDVENYRKIISENFNKNDIKYIMFKEGFWLDKMTTWANGYSQTISFELGKLD